MLRKVKKMNVIQMLEEEFESIKEDICDKICKFRDSSVVDPETGVLPECMNCPLERL